MSDEGEFDLDELDRLREMTKNINLFPGESSAKREPMESVVEEEKEIGDSSRGENSTPGKNSGNKREPVKKTLPGRPGPPSIQPGGIHARNPSGNSTKSLLKTAEVKKTAKGYAPPSMGLSQSQRFSNAVSSLNKAPSPASLTERRMTQDSKGLSLAESAEDLPLHNNQSKDSNITASNQLNQQSVDFRRLQQLPPGWGDEIGKLIEINAGMREDIEDKRDKLKAYIDRLTSMESTMADCLRRSEADNGKRQAELAENRRLAAEEVASARRLMEGEFKEKVRELESRVEEVAGEALAGVREATQGLLEEIECRKEVGRQVVEVMQSIDGVIGENFEAEERIRLKFERIYEGLAARLDSQASHGNISIEERIARARQQTQHDISTNGFDTDIQRIYEDQKKASSIKKFPLQRPVLPDTNTGDSEPFNIYNDYSRTQRTGRTVNEFSTGSSKALSYRGTSDKGKNLTSSQYSSPKFEPVKQEEQVPTANYPIEDIPDNISVSSRKSKRVLFNRKPISRSSKVDNEYGLQPSKDDKLKSQSAHKQFWNDYPQTDDQCDLQSQPDVMTDTVSVEDENIEVRSMADVNEQNRGIRSEKNKKTNKPLFSTSNAPYILTKKVGPKKPVINAGFPEC